MAIARPRLLRCLDAGLRAGRLIVVPAPAGFGKTTLLSAWLAELLAEECRYAPAWYTLDSRDNDPALFMRYVVAAAAGASRGSLSLPAAAADAGPDQLLNVLLQETAALDHDIILVLDDYHVINQPQVHELTRALIRNRPPRLHLVLTARHDPPLGLAALRAEDALTELRAADLAFNAEETLHFLRLTLGERVSAETAETLQVATEGWPVGLQLARLAMGDSTDIEAFVRGFREHSHRYVTDYLVSEVLETLPEVEQQFLLFTSILSQLRSDLCAAVIDTPDVAACQQTLERLEDRSLFVVGLDDRNEWYRYHAQFRLILRGLLGRRHSPEQQIALHRRAAVWYREAGDVEAAVEHLLAIGETAAAIDLALASFNTLYNIGDWATARRLLALLPAEQLAVNPDLLMVRIWLALREVDTPTIALLLDQLEGLLPAADDTPSESLRFLRAQIDAVRGFGLFPQTPIARRRELLGRALNGLPPRAIFIRNYVWLELVRMVSDPAELPRLAAMRRAERDAAADQPRLQLIIQYVIMLLYLRLGTLEEAEAETRLMLDMARESGSLSSTVRAHSAMAFIAICRNDLVTAAEYLEPLAANPLGGGMELILDLAMPAVTTLVAAGRPDRARAIINAAQTWIIREPGRYEVHALRALGLLLEGDLAGAVRMADEDQSPPPIYDWERRAIVMGLIRLAEGDPARLAAAAARLDRYLAVLAANEDRVAHILALVTRARMHWRMDEQAAALDRYEHALALGFARGFRRWYLGGSDVIEILSALAAADRHADEARQLLRLLTAERPPVSSMMTVPPAAALHETLSEREAEVLYLLANKMTNKQIAAALGISPITVRNHTVNLYGKLQVSTRAEAVSRGRELGLLRT